MKIDHNNCVITVSCRTASTRLPGKAFLPIAGIPSWQFLMNRLKGLPNLYLATTTLSSDDYLSQSAREYGFSVARGHEKDVFQRLLDIGNSGGWEFLIRITGDCPFVDHQMVLKAIETINSAADGWDLASTKGFTAPGLDLEIIRISSMHVICKKLNKEEREHVTLGFYSRKDKFKVNTINLEDYSGPGYYLLDTLEDYLSLVSKVAPHDALTPTLSLLQRGTLPWFSKPASS
jgi:spore coat polysaccharide biosynthesis protein SpsF